MNGVISASVSPGSSQRETRVTCTPMAMVPSGGTAATGTAPRETTRTRIRITPSTRIAHLRGKVGAEKVPRLGPADLGDEKRGRGSCRPAYDDLVKGIILAGGSGTRLYPATRGISKQLVAVYNKPMVYHPLSTLMLAGIREILLITTPEDAPAFHRLFGDGKDLGLALSYAVQPRPEGLAQAFIIGRQFVGRDAVALALRGHAFYGHTLPVQLQAAAARPAGATVFAYRVRDPWRYGGVTLGTGGRARGVEGETAPPR